MPYEVTVSQSHPRHIIAKRLVVEAGGLSGAMGRTFGQLYGYLGAIEVPPAGAPFAIYHAGLAMPERWDVELCAPVSRPVDPPTGCTCRLLAGGLVASTAHSGPYEALAYACSALRGWIVANGFEEAGAPREVYLSPLDTPASEIRAIIEWPVAKIAVGATG